MNRDLSVILGPFVAVLLFSFVVWQTVGALAATGVWQREPRTRVRAPDDPFAAVDRFVVDPAAGNPGSQVRDPFLYGGIVVSTTPRKPVVRKPVLPPPPARPQLTAIVWDADPRALVRWKDHEYTIRAGGLFDEFQVVNITRDQVILRRGAENIVLQRRSQGE